MLALREWATGAAHSSSLSLVCSGIQHASSSISQLSATRQSLGNYFHLLTGSYLQSYPQPKLSQNIIIPKLSRDTQEKTQSWLLVNGDLEQTLKLATMMPRIEYFKLPLCSIAYLYRCMHSVRTNTHIFKTR